METFYSVGKVAKICEVSLNTIIRCFDSGRLKGFRVPGSRFRRISQESLIRFMKENDIPLDRLGSNKKKVLYVDPDSEIVELMADILERDERFSVKTANCGYDAGVLTQEFLPDVIVICYTLPDVDANVVCKTIRQNPDFENIKFIVVDAPNDVEDIGANHFTKKPFSLSEIVEKIAELSGIEEKG